MWLVTQVVTGLPAGALAMLCLGSLLITPVITLLWWAGLLQGRVTGCHPIVQQTLLSCCSVR
ncbi:hypothetical protein BIV23_07235 [Streptomyces monashensis]|uniref:Uncharacterized protein n=1 Tax=Streptomyces monashensis TaxID=1678012 RepID=A0A1S2QKR8_9ACTN|nr:hypothetical protein BIV23_07235 [Streptomyces monashensis]